jgi:hypothetical protein
MKFSPKNISAGVTWSGGASAMVDPTSRVDSVLSARSLFSARGGKATRASHRGEENSYFRAGSLSCVLLKIRGVVTLVQLTGEFAESTIHYPPALHRRTVPDRISPALNVSIVIDLQKFGSSV